MLAKPLRAAAVAALLATIAAGPAQAAPCRGAGGKFVKCPAAAPAKPAKCKDAKGKYAKCGTPGAKPA